MAVANEWLDLIDDMIKYQFPGDVIDEIRTYGIASPNFYSVIKQLPGWSAIVNSKGNVTGYCRSLNADIASQLGEYDSNFDQTFLPPANVAAPVNSDTTATAAAETATKYVDGNKTAGSGLSSLGTAVNTVKTLFQIVDGAYMTVNVAAQIGRFLYTKQSGETWLEHAADFFKAIRDGGSDIYDFNIRGILAGKYTEKQIEGGPAVLVLDDGGDGTANNTLYLSKEQFAALARDISNSELFKVVAQTNFWQTSEYYKMINTETNNILPWVEVGVGDDILMWDSDGGSARMDYVKSADDTVYFSMIWSADLKSPALFFISKGDFSIDVGSVRSFNYAGTTYYWGTRDYSFTRDPSSYYVTVGGTQYTSYFQYSAYEIDSNKYSGILKVNGITDYSQSCKVTKETVGDSNYYFTQLPQGYLYYVEGGTDGKGGRLNSLISDDTAAGTYVCGYVTIDSSYSYFYYIVGSKTQTTYCNIAYEYNGTTVYVHSTDFSYYRMDLTNGPGLAGIVPAVYPSSTPASADVILQLFAEGVANGDFNTSPSYSIGEGGDVVTKGMRQFNINSDATDEEAAEQLTQQFPELENNRVEIPTVQEDGTVNTIIYYPIGGNIGSDGSTIYTPGIDYAGKSKLGVTTTTAPDGSSAPADYVNTGASIAEQVSFKPLTEPVTVNDEYTIAPVEIRTDFPNTGRGDAPIVVVPTETPSTLWTVYNPTLEQVNNFGAWLWSSNFVDQILKMFNDPMSAIIGFHEIYATPDNGDDSTIHVGYLDSGVSSKTVAKRYGTVDCGGVNMSEYFGNVFDYDPYTSISLYLPFIGFVQLSTADVMRGTIGIKYNVDFYTGACLAMVSVTRDSAGGVLYQYSGNCAAQIPLSSGSYMGIVTGVLGIAGSVVSGIASGGASIPIAMSAISQAAGMHTNIQHGGSFAGVSGAMGIKTPYVIISRPQVMLPPNFYDYTGLPSSATVSVGDCEGFIRFESIHLDGIPATTEEMDEIEQYLTTGIIV